MVKRLFVLLIIVFNLRTLAQTPSFDCKKVHTPAEQQICANPELAVLEKKMADLYKKLNSTLEGEALNELHRSQKAEVNLREGCRSGVSCIKNHLVHQIQVLEELNKKQRLAKLPLKHYKNQDYGFEFDYPATMTLTKKTNGSFMLDEKNWSQIGAAGGVVITSIHGSDTVELRVGARKGKDLKDACSSGDSYHREVVIDGITFQLTDLTGVGTGHSVEGESYQTFRDGICYSLERTYTSDSCGFYENKKEEEQCQIAARKNFELFENLELVVPSFRFMKK